MTESELTERAREWFFAQFPSNAEHRDCSVCLSEVEMLASFAAAIQKETREEDCKAISKLNVLKLAHEIVGDPPRHNYPAHSEAAWHMSEDYTRRVNRVVEIVERNLAAIRALERGGE